MTFSAPVLDAPAAEALAWLAAARAAGRPCPPVRSLGRSSCPMRDPNGIPG
jgi:hypothetical protein